MSWFPPATAPPQLTHRRCWGTPLLPLPVSIARGALWLNIKPAFPVFSKFNRMPRFIKIHFRSSENFSAYSLNALGRKFSSPTNFMFTLNSRCLASCPTPGGIQEPICLQVQNRSIWWINNCVSLLLHDWQLHCHDPIVIYIGGKAPFF